MKQSNEKKLLFIPVLFVIIFAIIISTQNQENEDTITQITSTTNTTSTITNTTSTTTTVLSDDQIEEEPEPPSGVGDIQEVDEPCQEIPQVMQVTNNRTKILLDAKEHFSIDSDDYGYLWQQVFSSKDSLEYVTSHKANLLNSSEEIAVFLPEVPGNYRFRLTAINSSGFYSDYELDVLVTKLGRELDVKGIIFGDIWGELGGPEFNIAPENPECLSKVLDHVYSSPVRVGSEWVGFVPAAFYKQVSPLPIFTDWGNTLSLTNESYYASLVGEAKKRGLKVMHTEQLAPGLDLTQDQWDSIDVMRKDPLWWDAWHDQWKKWVVPPAALAEKYDVEMFVLYLFADADTFFPELYPQYDEKWREIISEVRNVYSGLVAFSVINADERLTFVDAIDALIITIFPGLYISPGNIPDNINPTLSDLEFQTRGIINAAEYYFAGKVPIYYIFSAISSDGQQGGEPPPWGWGAPLEGQIDFLEQALYYEAFFNVIQEEDWIDGIFIERWGWFDQFWRTGDFFEATYYDSTLEASPRGKPAEEIVKLWFGIFE